MILIEKTEVVGWEHAIRGMRNPMNSWDKSDSEFPVECDGGYCYLTDVPKIGYRDMTLMKQLVQAGTDHRKFMRMIVVYCDITAPLYWWKEYDTYKVGTVANSCSTMHKIHVKEFTPDDFSHEHLIRTENGWIPHHKIEETCVLEPLTHFESTLEVLNACRAMYLKTKEKAWWESMIQLLPTSYNQKRTVMLNYEVLSNIYKSRKNHKLDEWRKMCKWIETLPYSGIITGKEGEADGKPENHEGDCEADSGGRTLLPEQ